MNKVLAGLIAALAFIVIVALYVLVVYCGVRAGAAAFYEYGTAGCFGGAVAVLALAISSVNISKGK